MINTMENIQYHVYTPEGRALSTQNKNDAMSEAKYYSSIKGESRIEMTVGYTDNTSHTIIARYENGKLINL